MTLTPTPGQTVGPFFGYALPYPGDSELVPGGHRDAIRLHGTVYDGAGEPIPDALLEIWQADQHGQVPQAEGSLHRDGYTFTGFGRAAVDATGHYSFTTVRPGPTQDGAAPFIAMTVFARGLINRLFTRVYLPVDDAALEADALLRSLPEDRRTHPGGDTGRGRLPLRRTAAGRRRDRLPASSRGRDGRPLLARRRAGRDGLRPGLPSSRPWSRSRTPGSTRSNDAGSRRTSTPTCCTGWSRRRDLDEIAAKAEASGNPVVPLVALMRERLAARDEDGGPMAAPRAHQPGRARHRPGAVRPCRARAAFSPTSTARWRHSSDLAERHRDDLMAGRTLTQHAVPITFGLKAAQWLQGVLDARDDLRALRFPVQVGGAAGTLAAVAELTGDADAAQVLVAEVAAALRPRPGPALAHQPRPLHPVRRRAGPCDRRLGPHRQRRARCWPGPRSPSSRSPPSRAAAVPRRCRRRPTRCCPCWSVEPR